MKNFCGFSRLIACLIFVSISPPAVSRELPVRISIDATYCLGRYIISLPSRSSINTSYKYGRQEINTINGLTEESYSGRIKSRLAELSKPNEKGGLMLVKQTVVGPNATLITSWFSSTTHLIHQQNLYAFFPSRNVLFIFSGTSDEERLQRAIEYRTELVTELKYRLNDEIPSSAGFCIDQGLIATSETDLEEYTAYIKFPELSGVTLSISSYVTGNPNPPLLDRIPRVLSAFANLASHMTALRRGEHDLGPVKAQEYLIRGDDKGIRSYEFTWESAGKENSIEFPAMSIVLSTTHDTPDGKIQDAAFKTDEEALKFWDSVLSTFRLRPGAV